MKFKWEFDAANQQLVTPFGHKVTVQDIATWLQDRTNSRHDLTGPWAGWRVRGRFLIGPGGIRTTPETLRKASPETG
jgi:hypothetical protein